MKLANRCNNNVCKLRLSTKVYNGWLVHSHTNSYLYWEQCMGGLTVSLRFFTAMQELSSLNPMNCTCYVVTSPSILCALWKTDLMTLCWTMNSLSSVTFL